MCCDSGTSCRASDFCMADVLTHCRTPRSSASPAHRPTCRAPTHARCSRATPASTTSSVLCRTAPLCRSTTRAGWSSWCWTRPSGRRSNLWHLAGTGAGGHHPTGRGQSGDRLPTAGRWISATTRFYGDY